MPPRTTNRIWGVFKSHLFLSLLIPAVAAFALPVGGQQEGNRQRPRRATGVEKLPPASTNSPNASNEEVDEGDVVRVETQLVSVPAVVTDAAGRQLAELRAENFIVFENGQKQTIANFGTTEAPFEIALLLDTSASTRDDVALIRGAALAFIEALRPGDRVAVIAFNSSKQGPTPRAMLLGSGLACYFIQVNTEDFVEDRLLKDCQDDGRLSLSAKQPQRYHRIFVPRAQSDEYENFCQMGPFQRMQISRDLYNLARVEMNQLAKTTGGKNFVAATLQDARAAFAHVATQIGTQYSLGYYPTNKARDGQLRTIRVELRGLQGKPQVRAREGYYAPKEK